MLESLFPSRKTRIVCTLGPASSSPEMLEALVTAGMNVARINFAHGSLEAHRQVIGDLRLVARRLGQRVALMGDLPGPKMRIGRLEREPLALLRGEPFSIQTGDFVGNTQRVALDFPGLFQAVQPGDRIFINDGYIQLRVDRSAGEQVDCTVEVGGELRSHKGVNFPGVDLGISAFTEHDQALLAFAAELNLDAVSVSFVSDADDILAVRRAAQALDYDPFIIAKIERARALENLEGILHVTDGVMVARGDLGVEIPIEDVAGAQKRLIRRAAWHARPVITATQMLESMIHNRRPTRAEDTDVANAILDGTDCVMLSGETAVGDFPVETVEMMGRIAAAAEALQQQPDMATELDSRLRQAEIPPEDHVTLSAYLTVETMKPSVVFTPAASGNTVRHLARFRLPVWLVAFSDRESTLQRFLFSYGVFPVHVPQPPDHWGPFAADWAHSHGMDCCLALLLEGGGTLRARDTTRIEMIRLG